ncbi:MAG: hypothetical protein JXB62_20105 [Pirellulales bacterium]|nr:hypothetical protein [Pirellulales bacterium]
MKRPVQPALRPSTACRSRGYTLFEILVATLLTLMMMAAVVQIFGMIGDSVADSRSTVEMAESLRTAATRLQLDLAGATVTMRPPRHPESDEGYFEYIEGEIGPNPNPTIVVAGGATRTLTPIDTDDPASPRDSTVGDIDDIVIFTTRSSGRPFVGRATGVYTALRWPMAGEPSQTDPSGNPYVQITVGPGQSLNRSSVESQVAEVAWFLRGTTLYRRVLLVAPGFLDADLRTPQPEFPVANIVPQGFYADFDISVRLENGQLVANTLGDLTKPENRYAHQPPGGSFPFHPHITRVGGNLVRTDWAVLGLPTLRESSYLNAANPWIAGGTLPAIALSGPGGFDAWVNPHPWPELDRDTGAYTQYLGPRVAEDVILNNVIGFDVKAWDPRAPVIADTNATANDPSDDVVYQPGDPDYLDRLSNVGTGNLVVASQGAYVDLFYTNNAASTLSDFSGPPHLNSGFVLSNGVVRAYDTWSFHYEHDGVDGDEGTNGFDDDSDGVVDDADEMEAPPPYAAPLRGIQVKIRVFEPSSRQIREVTIVQDFLPK